MCKFVMSVRLSEQIFSARKKAKFIGAFELENLRKA